MKKLGMVWILVLCLFAAQAQAQSAKAIIATGGDRRRLLLLRDTDRRNPHQGQRLALDGDPNGRFRGQHVAHSRQDRTRQKDLLPGDRVARHGLLHRDGKA